MKWIANTPENAAAIVIPDSAELITGGHNSISYSVPHVIRTMDGCYLAGKFGRWPNGGMFFTATEHAYHVPWPRIEAWWDLTQLVDYDPIPARVQQQQESRTHGQDRQHLVRRALGSIGRQLRGKLFPSAHVG